MSRQTVQRKLMLSGLIAVLALVMVGCGGPSGDPLEPERPFEGDATLADEFDVPVSLSSDSEWFAAVVQPGAVILEYPERETPFTRAVLILSAEPFGADNVDEWASQQEAVSMENRSEMQVSGYGTVVYDLTYDGEDELPLLSAQCCGGQIVLRNTEYYRVWVIDIDSDRPLVVFSPVLRGDLDWYEHAEEIVDSMEIG